MRLIFMVALLPGSRNDSSHDRFYFRGAPLLLRPTAYGTVTCILAQWPKITMKIRPDSYKSSWKRRIHGVREAHTSPSLAPPAWTPAAVRAFSPAPKIASERLVGRASVVWSCALVFRSVQRVGSTGAFSDSIPSRLKGPPGKLFASVSGHRAAVLRRTVWERRVVERRFRAFPTSLRLRRSLRGRPRGGGGAGIPRRPRC